MDDQSVPTSPPPPMTASLTFDIPYPEKSSRLWALATLLLFIPKALALLPHLIILYVLQYVGLVAFLAGQIVVLFTGRFPRPLFAFLVGITRWRLRVTVFFMGLTDIYPPFTFK